MIAFVGMRELEYAPSDPFGAAISKHASHGRGIVEYCPVGRDQRDRILTVLDEGPEPFLTLLPRLLGPFAVGDVLHRGQKIERLARGGLYQSSNQMNPDNPAVFSEILLVNLECSRLRRRPSALRMLDGRGAIVRMDNFGKAESGQLRGGVPRDPAEHLVHAQEAVVQRDNCRAERRLVERNAEPLLALAQGLFGLFSLGNLHDDGADAFDSPIRPGHREIGQHPMPLQTGGSARLAGKLEVQDRFPGGEDVLQDGLDQRRKRGNDFADGPAKMFFDRDSVHLGQGLVDADVPQLLVKHRKPRRCACEKCVQLPLSLGHGVLQPFALGDVDVRAQHPLSFALFVQYQRGLREKPSIRAVLVAEAEFKAVVGPWLRDERPDGLEATVEIIGMDAILPFQENRR